MTQIIHSYSTQATRTRPWENWVEPTVTTARYCGLIVKVVEAGNHLAVIDWDGHRLLVEVGDLEVLRVKEVAV